jgi:hypothetical protein
VVRCGGIYAGPSKGGAYVSPPPPPPTPPLLSLPLRCPKKSRRTPRLYLWGERSSESSFPFVGCVAVARVLLRGFLFRRCRTKRKPFESFATPPFPRLLGWESCRNGRFSCLFSWTGEQSRGPSLVGPVRDESPTITYHDLGFTSSGYRRMRTGPFAIARGQISPEYYIPFPPRPFRSFLLSGDARIRGGTHFLPSGPGNRV